MSTKLVASDGLSSLLSDIRACRECEVDLPFGPRPIVQAGRSAKVLLVGQAPGRRVHDSGIPWDDPSGDRLRQWLGIERERFYDPNTLAIMPMGFCYPGTGRSGDLPPRKECEKLWHQALLDQLPDIELTLYIGQYAQKHYLGKKALSLTDRVRQWQHYFPESMPLPHPSPRNRRWFASNTWFEKELVPVLQKEIARFIS